MRARGCMYVCMCVQVCAWYACAYTCGKGAGIRWSQPYDAARSVNETGAVCARAGRRWRKMRQRRERSRPGLVCQQKDGVRTRRTFGSFFSLFFFAFIYPKRRATGRGGRNEMTIGRGVLLTGAVIWRTMESRGFIKGDARTESEGGGGREEEEEGSRELLVPACSRRGQAAAILPLPPSPPPPSPLTTRTVAAVRCCRRNRSSLWGRRGKGGRPESMPVVMEGAAFPSLVRFFFGAR